MLPRGGKSFYVSDRPNINHPDSVLRFFFSSCCATTTHPLQKHLNHTVITDQSLRISPSQFSAIETRPTVNSEGRHKIALMNGRPSVFTSQVRVILQQWLPCCLLYGFPPGLPWTNHGWRTRRASNLPFRTPSLHAKGSFSSYLVGRWTNSVCLGLSVRLVLSFSFQTDSPAPY
jgi:hypothetical protein